MMNRKSVLVKTVLFSFSLLTFGNALAQSNRDADMYVSSGYPYEDVVQRFDLVKIRYIEHKDTEQIQCRVELARKGVISESNPVYTNPKDFLNTPLKACLSRHEAKQALAATFD